MIKLNKAFKKPRKYLWYFLGFLFLLFIFCLPSKLFNSPYSTVVLAKDGQMLGARIAADGQWRFPLSESIPEKLKTCLVYFEDEYFYWHWGVNPISMGKAFIQNLKARKVVRGGSTLTMQTIRLSRQKPRTILEKVIESILATRLEFSYSKDEILNLYASHAPFGGNVVGYTAAAWRYFGHTASSLSWAEAATLAVLPNAPSAIHLAKARTQLETKRNGLLKKLYDDQVIDADEYELALAEPLPSAPLPLPQIAPHLVSKIAMSKPSQEVITTIDFGLQHQVEELVNSWNNHYKQHNIHDISAIIIDVQTSEILAYHGNSGFQTGRVGSQVNILDAPRSTGSILKPFLLASMLDEGELLPNQLLPDVPINISGFSPQNFSLTYEGAVPASQAIIRSLNIPSVYMLKAYSVPKFYEKLKGYGLSTLNKSSGHYGLSLILGGAEAKLAEITAAYVRLAQSALSLESKEVYFLQDAKPITLPSVVSNGAAWQTLDIIKEVYRPGEVAWKMMGSMQNIAWKTGTSHGFRDGWAVGVTPLYAVGVWLGNATGEGNAELVGTRTAGPVLFDLFNILPKSDWFERPKESLVEAEICRQSGHLKGRFCQDVDTLLILPQGMQTTACPYHHPVYLTADGKNRVYTSCVEAENAVEQSWFTLPPVWEWYYKNSHPDYRVLPPFKAGCGEDSRTPMQFIYPQQNTKVVLTRQLDGSLGGLTLDLAHSDDRAIVFWHMDGEYLDQTEHIHKLTLSPGVGEHQLTVVDNYGNTASIRFYSSILNE